MNYKFFIISLLCCFTLISSATIQHVINHIEGLPDARKIEATSLLALAPFLAKLPRGKYEFGMDSFEIAQILLDCIFAALEPGQHFDTDYFDRKLQPLITGESIENASFVTELWKQSIHQCRATSMNRPACPVTQDMKRGLLLYFETLSARRAFHELFTKFDALFHVNSENFFILIHSLNSLSENCFEKWALGFQKGHGAYDLMQSLKYTNFSDAFKEILWHQYSIYDCLTRIFPFLIDLWKQVNVGEPFRRFLLDNDALLQRCKSEAITIKRIFQSEDKLRSSDLYLETVREAFYFSYVHSMNMSDFLERFISVRKGPSLPEAFNVFQEFLQEKEEEKFYYLERIYHFFNDHRQYFDFCRADEIALQWAIISDWLNSVRSYFKFKSRGQVPFIRSRNIFELKPKLIDALDISFSLTPKAMMRLFSKNSQILKKLSEHLVNVLCNIFDPYFQGSPVLVMSPAGKTFSVIWGTLYQKYIFRYHASVNTARQLAAFQSCAYHFPDNKDYFLREILDCVSFVGKRISYNMTRNILQHNLNLFHAAMVSSYSLDEKSAESLADTNKMLMTTLPSAVPVNLDESLGLASVIERKFLNFVDSLNFVFEKLGFKKVRYMQAWNTNQSSATVHFDLVSKYRKWAARFRKKYLNDLNLEFQTHQLLLFEELSSEITIEMISKCYSIFLEQNMFDDNLHAKVVAASLRESFYLFLGEMALIDETDNLVLKTDQKINVQKFRETFTNMLGEIQKCQAAGVKLRAREEKRLKAEAKRKRRAKKEAEEHFEKNQEIWKRKETIIQEMAGLLGMPEMPAIEPDKLQDYHTAATKLLNYF